MLKIIYSFVLHLSIVRSCLILLDIKGARGARRDAFCLYITTRAIRRSAVNRSPVNREDTKKN